MKKCIFCEKQEDEFENGNEWSIEHIIPQSLGNKYLNISNVCKNCNNTLGSKIDAYFSNSLPVDIKRCEYGIEKPKGRLPAALQEGADNQGRKMRILDGFRPSYIPSVDIDGNKYHYHTSSKDELEKMVTKSLRRKNFSNEIIEKVHSKIEKLNVTQSFPEINFLVTLDINRYLAEILKIAYEYATYKLGDSYFEDPRAKEIRAYFAALPEPNEQHFAPPQGIADFPQSLEHNIVDGHLIGLCPTAEGNLVAVVSLFGGNPYLVYISDDYRKYDLPSGCWFDFIPLD